MEILTLQEDNLKFTFPNGWIGSAYDNWAFYRKHFQRACEADHKAIDFVVKDTEQACLWLIEVKDYRQHPRTKTTTIWGEMATKVRDSLAGIFAAKYWQDHDKQSEAIEFLKAQKIRVVLHFEQPRNDSKLFPRAFNISNIQLKLRSKGYLRAIDPHVLVVESDDLSKVPWAVQSVRRN